jgi:hypothetical protein
MGNQPHIHTVEEAKANIKRIEHNSEGGNGPPSGIEGGSGGNYNTGTTEGVPPKTKGGDWIGGSRRK